MCIKLVTTVDLHHDARSEKHKKKNYYICQMAAACLEHTRVGCPLFRSNVQGKSNFPILWPCLSEYLVELDIF
jgi:hypothetical protein